MFLTTVFSGFGLLLLAQDIHFSQYYNAPLALNPALAGIYEGDRRFGATYRNQWQSALVPYTTVLGSFDQKLKFGASKRGFFGGGLNFYYDEAGDANLSVTNFNLSGNYSLILNEESMLTFGIQAGVSQRSFKLSELTFDSQWNGEQFDPSRAIMEDFDRTSIVYPDFGVGLNFHGRQQDRRTSLDAGAALFHPFQPNQSFSDGDPSELPIRYSLYLLPMLQVADRVDFVLHGMAQLQDVYLEALAGGGIRYHISTQKGRQFAVQAGAAYRFNSIGDSVIPAVELHYRGWQAGFSYDVNVSDYSVATNRNGGPELTLRHIITYVKPLKEFKLCPLI